MQRLKILGLAVVAVLALSAVAAGSASATCTTKAKSGLMRMCVENTPAHSNIEVTATLTSATANLGLKLESGLLKNSTLICKKMAAGATHFSNPEKAAVQLVGGYATLMSECHLEGDTQDPNLNKKCITISNWQSTIAGKFGTSAELLKMESELKLPIGAVQWKNNGTETCPYSRENTYYGSWECKLHEPEVEKVAHELVCETTNGILFGEEEGTSLKYTQSIALAGAEKGKKFKIYEASNSSE
jgi:hypothetical protein